MNVYSVSYRINNKPGFSQKRRYICATSLLEAYNKAKQALENATVANVTIVSISLEIEDLI